jgi:hypothetical protein
MLKWLHNNKWIESIKDFPENTFGFIYITTHNVKKKLTKKELAEQTGRGRKSTTQTIQKESDWKTYYGSAKPILELIKQGKQKDFTRKILCLVPNKKLLTYYECKYLFQLGVLENSDEWINDNILGKFYRKDFVTQE